jgi:hypothetical protein
MRLIVLGAMKKLFQSIAMTAAIVTTWASAHARRSANGTSLSACGSSGGRTAGLQLDWNLSRAQWRIDIRSIDADEPLFG